MDKSELNKKVSQKLCEFDTLGRVSPSDEWSMTLMEKIDSVNQYSFIRLRPSRFTIVILLITLINIGVILATTLNNTRQVPAHINTLEIISKEMLVNPNSLNN